MQQRVVGWRFALCVGVAVAIAGLVAALVRPAPESIVGWLGGPTGVERWGGLRVRVKPLGGGVPKTIELPRVAESQVLEALEVVRYGLSFREVHRVGYPRASSGRAIERLSPGLLARSSLVDLHIDQWDPTAGRRVATSKRYSLTAASLAQIADLLDEARGLGWNLDEDAVLGYGETLDFESGRLRFTSYEMNAQAVLDGRAIDHVLIGQEPGSGELLVKLRFTEEGAERFCEISGRVMGEKLALVIGTRVISAPIVNGEICGGEVSLSLSNGESMDRALALAAAMEHARDLGAGSDLLAQEIVPPSPLGWQGWVARLLLAMGLGGLVGLATALLLRLARPSWRRADGPPSPPATSRSAALAGRIAITLLAPAALFLGSRIDVPGIELVSIGQQFHPEASLDPSLLALGLTPLLVAFLAVELFAHLTERHRLAPAVVAVTLALALLQAHAHAARLEALELVSGLLPILLVMVSLTGATLLLALIAGVISKRGLGNGYGALLLSLLLLSLAGALPSQGCGAAGDPAGDLGVLLRGRCAR